MKGIEEEACLQTKNTDANNQIQDVKRNRRIEELEKNNRPVAKLDGKISKICNTDENEIDKEDIDMKEEMLPERSNTNLVNSKDKEKNIYSSSGENLPCKNILENTQIRQNTNIENENTSNYVQQNTHINQNNGKETEQNICISENYTHVIKNNPKEKEISNHIQENFHKNKEETSEHSLKDLESSQENAFPKKRRRKIYATEVSQRVSFKRKAAEASETKWKNAMSQEKAISMIQKRPSLSPTKNKLNKGETFSEIKPLHEASSELKLETKNKSRQRRKRKLPNTRPEKTSPKSNRNSAKRKSRRTKTQKRKPKIQPEISSTINLEILEKTNFTIIEDKFFNDIFGSLLCPVCFKKSLNPLILKNTNGLTKSVSVSCSKCRRCIVKKDLALDLPRNVCHVLSTLKNQQDLGLSRNQIDNSIENCIENNSNVEMLVCDVDVLDEGNNTYQIPYDNQVANGSLADDDSYENVNNSFAENKINEEQRDFSSPQIPVISHKRKRRKLRGKGRRRPHINPSRPCYYCGEMQKSLSQHIRTEHLDQPYVHKMLMQPVPVQAKMIRQLRSEGIYAENRRRQAEGRTDLLMIRNQGIGEITACPKCKGYYKKKLMWRHRDYCLANEDLGHVGVGVGELETYQGHSNLDEDVGRGEFEAYQGHSTLGCREGEGEFEVYQGHSTFTISDKKFSEERFESETPIACSSFVNNNIPSIPISSSYSLGNLNSDNGDLNSNTNGPNTPLVERALPRGNIPGGIEQISNIVLSSFNHMLFTNPSPTPFMNNLFNVNDVKQNDVEKSELCTLEREENGVSVLETEKIGTCPLAGNENGVYPSEGHEKRTSYLEVEKTEEFSEYSPLKAKSEDGAFFQTEGQNSDCTMSLKKERIDNVSQESSEHATTSFNNERNSTAFCESSMKVIEKLKKIKGNCEDKSEKLTQNSEVHTDLVKIEKNPSFNENEEILKSLSQACQRSADLMQNGDVCGPSSVTTGSKEGFMGPTIFSGVPNSNPGPVGYTKIPGIRKNVNSPNLGAIKPINRSSISMRNSHLKNTQNLSDSGLKYTQSSGNFQPCNAENEDQMIFDSLPAILKNSAAKHSSYINHSTNSHYYKSQEKFIEPQKSFIEHEEKFIEPSKIFTQPQEMFIESPEKFTKSEERLSESDKPNSKAYKNCQSPKNCPQSQDNYLKTPDKISKKYPNNFYYEEQTTHNDDDPYYLFHDGGGSDSESPNTLKNQKKRKPNRDGHQFWTTEQVNTIINYFSDCIHSMKVPGKDRCRDFLIKYPEIKTDWTRVKYKVYNQIQKRKKKLN